MTEYKKSRTVRLDDAEWADITNAAVIMGFGTKGRGKCVLKLARDEIKRHERAERRDAGS